MSVDVCAAADRVAAAGWGSGCSGSEWAAGVQSAGTGSKRLHQRHTVTRRRQQQHHYQIQDLHTVTDQTDGQTDRPVHILESPVCMCVALFLHGSCVYTLSFKLEYFLKKNIVLRWMLSYFKWNKMYLSSPFKPIFVHFCLIICMHTIHLWTSFIKSKSIAQILTLDRQTL